MKSIVLSFAFLAVVPSGLAQNLTPESKRMPYLYDLFNGMSNARPPSQVIGNVYLGTHWDPVHVALYEPKKEIDGYFARYNLQANELEFQTPLGTKALEGSKAKSFSMRDSLTGITRNFVNAKEFSLNEVPLIGFLEIISAWPYPLMKRHYLVVQEPDYKPSLNSGSRDTRISQKYDLLYARGNELFKVPNKRKLLTSFGSKAQEVEAYMKTNSLFVSEEADLIRIFDYYNSIAQP